MFFLSRRSKGTFCRKLMTNRRTGWPTCASRESAQKLEDKESIGIHGAWYICHTNVSGTQKMEVLNLMFGYFGVGKLPYISHIHTAYTGEKPIYNSITPQEFRQKTWPSCGMAWNVCLCFGMLWHFSDLLMNYPLMSYPNLSTLSTDPYFDVYFKWFLFLNGHLYGTQNDPKNDSLI